MLETQKLKQKNAATIYKQYYCSYIHIKLLMHSRKCFAFTFDANSNSSITESDEWLLTSCKILRRSLPPLHAFVVFRVTSMGLYQHIQANWNMQKSEKILNVPSQNALETKSLERRTSFLNAIFITLFSGLK